LPRLFVIFGIWYSVFQRVGTQNKAKWGSWTLFFMTQRGATFFNVPNVFWGLYLYKGGATIIDL